MGQVVQLALHPTQGLSNAVCSSPSLFLSGVGGTSGQGSSANNTQRWACAQKIHKVLEMYKNQEITLWKAAEIAGVSLAELLSELPKHKIVFQYDVEELKEDVEYARGK